MEKAAKQEDWDAMYWLAMWYSQGDVGTPPDAERSLYWMRRAADMGHPDAQYGLGSAFLVGDGVETNSELAAEWFGRAARNGNACAQCNLGALYAQGLGGLAQDLSEALRWYRASAEQGNADGQHNLAIMHVQGLGGLTKDMAKAREWCAKAAAQGQEKAIAMLHDLPEARLEDEVEC